MVLEVLVPASEVELLRGAIGTLVTFHTWMFLQGESGGGNSEPRLLGFARREDKGFFLKFIEVKGIGPTKALKALAMPVGEIAAAIEGKDARVLSKLPGIGKRTAEQVIAELSGKVQQFIGVNIAAGKGAMTVGMARRTSTEEDAILILVALGERRLEAEALLERARADGAPTDNPDELARAMLGLRGR
jgi:holliday junction DNA helicase RuvA